MMKNITNDFVNQINQLSKEVEEFMRKLQKSVSDGMSMGENIQMGENFIAGENSPMGENFVTDEDNLMVENFLADGKLPEGVELKQNKMYPGESSLVSKRSLTGENFQIGDDMSVIKDFAEDRKLPDSETILQNNLFSRYDEENLKKEFRRKISKCMGSTYYQAVWCSVVVGVLCILHKVFLVYVFGLF